MADTILNCFTHMVSRNLRKTKECVRSNGLKKKREELTMTKLSGLTGILLCFRGSPPKSMVITVVRGVVFLGGFFSKIVSKCLGFFYVKIYILY